MWSRTIHRYMGTPSDHRAPGGPGRRARGTRRRAPGGLPARPGRRPKPRLEVSPPGLLDLDRLEQGLEVANAEAARAVPLDDLEEEGRPVLDRPGEDLEEVALLVAVGLDAELLERLDRDADVADAIGERLVVGMR